MLILIAELFLTAQVSDKVVCLPAVHGIHAAEMETAFLEAFSRKWSILAYDRQSCLDQLRQNAYCQT